MKTTKPKRANGAIKSLADALGVSTRQITNLLADGMPEQIPAALEWYGLRTAASTAEDYSPAELRRRRIILLDEQTRKTRMENDQKENRLIDVGTAKEALSQICSEARARLLKLPYDLPPVVSGLAESATAKVIRDHVITALADLNAENAFQLTIQKQTN